MSMNATLHDPVTAKAYQADCGTSWLTISTDRGYVTVFMPFDRALRMALAFHENPPAPVDPDFADPAANDYDDGGITP